MCGIAGIVAPSVRVIPGAVIGSMLRNLRHRGPDGTGWLSDDGVRVCRSEPLTEETRGIVWLIHRRLSILDTSDAGLQPMSAARGRYFIVFNGEIYNFKELRAELEVFGERFSTGTDTEVLLSAYIRFGAAVLPRLIGMFALAVYDRQARTVFLARDCFGIKPLYFTVWHDALVFASEIKVFCDLPAFKKRVDPHILYEYLRFGLADHSADTLLEGVHQLPPGTWAEVSLDSPTSVNPVKYWTLTPSESTELTFSDAAEQLRQMFLDSVRLHVRSDVQIGACLSGGIDSSSIVCAVRTLEPSLELRTYSYVADDATLTEERWMDIVNAACPTSSSKVHCSGESLLADLDGLITAQDVPFGSTSIYAQYKVFQRASEDGVKVVLDGQGADELLAGYEPYLMVRLASLIRAGDLSRARRLASKLRSRGYGARLWLHLGRHLTPRFTQSALRTLFDEPLMPRWLNGRWFHDRGILGKDPRSAPADGGILKGLLKDDLTVFMIPGLLRFADRNAMAHSVENRVPFLTPQLAQFLMSLPEDYLVSDEGRTKSIFRAAMRGIVPNPILDRSDKVGLATPERQWFTQGLQGWVERMVKTVDIDVARVLDVGGFRDELAAMMSGRKAFHFRAWRCVNFIVWRNAFDVEIA